MKRTLTLSTFRSVVPLALVWLHIRRAALVIAGATLAAFGFSLFQLPYNLAAGGVSGLGVILTHVTGVSAGVLFFVANVPLLILGFFFLGRWRFLVHTTIGVLTFSVAADQFTAAMPSVLGTWPMTDDMLLSAIYAGIVTGIGAGLVHSAGATMGGTAVTGRIIQLKTGMPLSQIYLYTDSLIIILAGVLLGWDSALCAMLTLFLSGIATDYVMEGPALVRTATIVTRSPNEMIGALASRLNRGSSYWEVKGGYTGEPRSVVFCTFGRQQMFELKQVVAEVDPTAFVVIGEAHHALGSGFHKMPRPEPGPQRVARQTAARSQPEASPNERRQPAC